jgi:hypothetical protein
MTLKASEKAKAQQNKTETSNGCRTTVKTRKTLKYFIKLLSRVASS